MFPFLPSVPSFLWSVRAPVRAACFHLLQALFVARPRRIRPPCMSLLSLKYIHWSPLIRHTHTAIARRGAARVGGRSHPPTRVPRAPRAASAGRGGGRRTPPCATRRTGDSYGFNLSPLLTVEGRHADATTAAGLPVAAWRRAAACLWLRLAVGQAGRPRRTEGGQGPTIKNTY